MELETPYLVKYTPGGARNFLGSIEIISRMFLCALAESPQLFKQLFMVAGFDRYFQIAKCFRDEDLRQDRQPEFTQIDVEMSFADIDDIFPVMETIVRNVWKTCLETELPDPFPIMSYDEAMRRFGSDKPDVRFGLEHIVLTDIAKKFEGGGLPLIDKAVSRGGMVKALRVPGEHAMSRTDIEKLEVEAKGVGALGLGRAKIGPDGSWVQSPFAKTVSDAYRQAINEACEVQEGDLLLFQFGSAKLVHTVMNHLRLHLGRKLGIIPEDQWAILWITDFPLFEHDEESNTFAAAHHPFTCPRLEDVDRLVTDPASCKARAYDLVLNGNEIAGGSVRIHDPSIQAKVFEALGIGPEEQQTKFGFLLDALSFGAPPHAGIAAGLDRLVMLAAKAQSLRDVIPFPKTQKGQDMMSGAPTPVADKQLKDLYVRTIAVE